jgi:hypothetical protein
VQTVTTKFDAFRKIFTQLSGESQDKLVKIAHHLQKARQLAVHDTVKQTKIRQRRKGDKK